MCPGVDPPPDPAGQEPIELSLFAFIDEFAAQVKGGDPGPLDKLSGDSKVIVFCQSFFVQFFGKVLDVEIDGFDAVAKRAAAGLAVDLQGEQTKAPIRAIIALFEKFCDMYADVVAGSYAASEITYRVFHRQYVSRLLGKAEAWAGADGHTALSAQIAKSRTVYEAAISQMKW